MGTRFSINGAHMAIALFVGIGVVWLTIGFTLNAALSRENAALLGDSFNTVNALFSALAFGALVIGVFLQRSEWLDARKDMKESMDLQLSALAEARKSKQSEMLVQCVSFHLTIKGSFQSHETVRTSTRSSSPLTRDGESSLRKWWSSLDLAWKTGSSGEQETMTFAQHVRLHGLHEHVRSIYDSIGALLAMYLHLDEEQKALHLNLIKMAIGRTEQRVVLMYNFLGEDSANLADRLKEIGLITDLSIATRDDEILQMLSPKS